MPLATGLQVSSVLHRDHDQFGKQHLLDGSVETCWNSDQGTPQLIQIHFDEDAPVDIDGLQIMFQGGFVGKDCTVLGSQDGTTFPVDLHRPFFPQDNNTLQSFPLSSSLSRIQKLRIVFGGSTDFYGRVTIYQLQVLGRVSSEGGAPWTKQHEEKETAEKGSCS